MNTHRLLLKALASITIFAISANSRANTDQEWPREIVSGKTIITLYQPDVESLTNNKMEARAAVSVVTGDNPSPVFGAVWLNCRISTDFDDRTVELIDVNVESAKFPDIDESKVQHYSNLLEQEIPQWELTMSLDELLASMEYDENTGSNSENYNNNPPEIIFASNPTALVLIDGEPIFKRLETSDYEYVENTPFFIARHLRTGRLYLKGGKFWYSSTSLEQGWSTIMSPPAFLEDYAQQAMENNTEEQEDFEVEYSNIAPAIIVRTSPAELIQSNGTPQYASVEKTSLLFMTNTDDDIIMDINNQDYYTLISGRWYKAKSLNSNNWIFVAPNELPADFAQIPEESEIANVRSSVYGTTEAREAVLENQIPQTATIDRNEARVEVGYDGDPRFEEIRGTTMRYAINTNKSVLLIHGRYYCCDNAVWFESFSPHGPWVVSTYIPEEIRNIPPEYPVYNVKYVYIYDYTPDVVYVGYTPGYMHCYTYRGCVYYGTGYYYRPWYGQYYYPRHYTYGFRVRYNPFTGWGFTYGIVYGGPRYWVGYGWHSHYYSYWGPIGYRYAHPHHYYHHYDHAYKRGYYQGYADGRNDRYQARNVYGERRSSSHNVYQYRNNGVSRSGSSVYNSRTGERVSVNQTSSRQARVSSNPNNVYTDRSGNIYRRDDNGKWQQRRSGQWQEQSRNTQDTRRESSSVRQRQSTSRSDANTRTETNSGRQNQNQTQTGTRDSRDSRQSDNRNSQNATDNRATDNQQNMNRQYESRNRGNQRNEDYQQSRQSNQQTQQDRQTRQTGTQTQQNTQQTRQNNQQTRENNQQSQQNSQQTRQSRDNNRSSQGNTRTSTNGNSGSRSSGKVNSDNSSKENNRSGNSRSSSGGNSRSRTRD